MTMQERQAELLKEQQQKKNELQKSGWGASLDVLGTLGSNPASLAPSPSSKPSTPVPAVSTAPADDDDDPFDVFNKPPPPKVAPKAPTPPPSRPTPSSVAASHSDPADTLLEGFTDAFPPPRQVPSRTPSSTGSTRASTPASERRNSPKPAANDPRDHSIAELVDMGFSIEQAKRGLANTNTGLDVRQAIDFLMREAHSKATGQPMEPPRPSSAGSNRAPQAQDISKLAQEFSNQFISKGRSFFNQGRKNIAKAIEQYKANTPDDGTPAWMRNQEKYIEREEKQKARKWDEDAKDVVMPSAQLTDEARALESHTKQDGSSSRQEPHQHRARTERTKRQPERFDLPVEPKFKDEFKDDLSNEPSRTPSPSIQRPVASKPRAPPAAPMSRAQQFKNQKFDEDMPMSSRRRQTPKPKPPTEFKSTIPDRPKVAPRAPVAVSSMQLDMFSTARTSGTEAFKRGDFTEATTHYTQALASIPAGHVLRAIVLSNRSTCYMKLGDSKAALGDAEEGLMLIGPGLGADEEAEAGKPLKEIWSKLATRKAEALESRDQFKESLATWNLLIENGYSSKIALDGKRRCLQALEPKPKAAAKPASKPSTPRPSSAAAGTAGPTSSAAADAALKRMREANQENEKEDAEKFALVDIVDSKVNAWRGGKEDNLRGLISTVDILLWPELNWKKVSLADLVLPKKVKINYMKVVAKTHPDKVPASATTEQKMIAQAVFVTLNKAWDDFKVANGLN